MNREPGIALITGASSGIGEAFARYLTACTYGSKVCPGLPAFDEIWLVARRGDRLLALAEELLKTFDGSAGGKTGEAASFSVRSISLDLSKPESIKQLEQDVREAEKPLKILINNAGYGTYGPFSEVDLDWQLGQIDLNCRSLTEMCGRMAPYLQKGSLVLNTASLAAFAPLGGFAVYAASKAYVLSFTAALAAEWRNRGIKLSALCPGSVQSEFALVASEGVRKEVLHGFDPGRLVTYSLEKAARGRIVLVQRIKWKINRIAGIIAGPVLSARFAWRFMRRPHKTGNGE